LTGAGGRFGSSRSTFGDRRFALPGALFVLLGNHTEEHHVARCPGRSRYLIAKRALEPISQAPGNRLTTGISRIAADENSLRAEPIEREPGEQGGSLRHVPLAFLLLPDPVPDFERRNRPVPRVNADSTQEATIGTREVAQAEVFPRNHTRASFSDIGQGVFDGSVLVRPGEKGEQVIARLANRRIHRLSISVLERAHDNALPDDLIGELKQDGVFDPGHLAIPYRQCTGVLWHSRAVPSEDNGQVWTTRRAMLVLVGCNVLWAGTYVAGKTALHSLSAIELNCLRFGVAGLTLLPLLWKQRHAIPWDRGSVLRLAGLCLLGFVLNKIAEFSGLSLTTASDTALLISSEGIFTALFGWILLREVVRGGAVLGLLLSLVGAYLVIERGFVVPAFGNGTRVIGDLLVVGALVFEALYSVLGKSALQRLPMLAVTSGCVIGSLAVWVPAAIVNVVVAGTPRMDLVAWLAVLYLAIGGTTLAYVGWFAALRFVDASAAAPTLFLQPFLGTVLAVLLLRERLSWASIAGGLCIVGGIWMVSRIDVQAERMTESAEVLA
jgi:drug/metabolite transporter (DMT)-like permease